MDLGCNQMWSLLLGQNIKRNRLLRFSVTACLLEIEVIPKRFERLTHALEGRCSIQLSYGTILNCAAKVRTIIEMCKKKTIFILRFGLNRVFFACTSRPVLKCP